VPYPYSLVIGLTILGSVIDALTRRRPLSFPPLDGASYEEVADMTDFFAGQSGWGGEKRTTAAPALKYAVVNNNSKVDVICCMRWDTLNRQYAFYPSI